MTNFIGFGRFCFKVSRNVNIKIDVPRYIKLALNGYEFPSGLEYIYIKLNDIPVNAINITSIVIKIDFFIYFLCVSNGRVQKYVTYLCSLFSSTMVSNLWSFQS